MIAPTDADIGRRVYYRADHPGSDPEIGRITSYTAEFVFVRYSHQHPSAGGQATMRRALFWTLEEAESRH